MIPPHNIWVNHTQVGFFLLALCMCTYINTEAHQNLGQILPFDLPFISVQLRPEGSSNNRISPYSPFPVVADMAFHHFPRWVDRQDDEKMEEPQ